jgi:tRNA dimethylallyltransferase
MTVFVLVGPTSSGKTRLGLELGQANSKLEIISADSRQIIKNMDIGTGKTPLGDSQTVVKQEKCWIINGVKVWGYDLISPSDYFSAYDFANFAKNTIEDIYERSSIPIVIGGTGFFVDSLTGRMDLSAPAPNFKLRDELNQLSLESALEKLKGLNEADFRKIDQKNKLRVIRAIERNVLPAAEKQAATDLTFRYYGLFDERKNLYYRVDRWAESIWGDLLYNEVRSLIDLGYEDLPPLKGLVYKTALSYLNGNIGLEEGLERVKFDLHAYIRRQQTWFKKNESITWLNVDDLKKNVALLGNALTLD